VTKQAIPCIVYKCRGDMSKLDRLLGWWTKLNTKVPLSVRLDEDDDELPAINDIIEKYEKGMWSCWIGPPVFDQGEITLEFYDQWKDMSNRLVYVTDSPSSIATFIMSYENQSKKDD
jgi:hypothetical protein